AGRTISQVAKRCALKSHNPNHKLPSRPSSTRSNQIPKPTPITDIVSNNRIGPLRLWGILPPTELGQATYHNHDKSCSRDPSAKSQVGSWRRLDLPGREPVMRISTSLLALCRQSGVDATLETPIRARSRSKGSRS